MTEAGLRPFLLLNLCFSPQVLSDLHITVHHQCGADLARNHTYAPLEALDRNGFCRSLIRKLKIANVITQHVTKLTCGVLQPRNSMVPMVGVERK